MKSHGLVYSVTELINRQRQPIGASVMNIDSYLETDVVVIGAGLAGIKAANDLSDAGADVVLLSESKFGSGASFHPVKASLGTQVTKDEQDRRCFHEDIREMGEGMQNDQLASVYVDEIASEVSRYSEIGVFAQKLEGGRKACFANHERDVYLLSDWEQMRRNAAAVIASKDIRVLEKHLACCCYLVAGRVAGVFVLDRRGRWMLIKSQAVILASGGFSSIYKHSLYPPDVDGSGHVIALNAGAELVNMEFVQFIPALISPKYGTLFGEHTLRYAKDIVDGTGHSLIQTLAGRGHDVQAMFEQRSGYAPFSYSMSSSCLDIAMMDHIIATGDESGFQCLFHPELYTNNEQFFTVYLDWLKSRGIDFLSDDIRLLPFAHAANGGVAINRDGATGVDGLYAIGELSANVEGANRLGGNSTGACMVFGARAARACRRYIDTVKAPPHSDADARAFLQRTFALEPGADSDRVMSDREIRDMDLRFRKARNEVKDIMYYSGGVVRTEQSLLQAIDRLAGLKSSLPIAAAIRNAQTRRKAIKIARQIDIAIIALEAMNERKESRGAHFRRDFPVMKSQYGQNLFVRLERGQRHRRFAHYDSA